MTPNDIIARLTRRRIVPVVRTPTAEAAETAVAWLSEAGIGIFEITMTVPGAVHVIRSLSAGNKDALIGAGTVFTAAEAEACIEAGARFIVSPATVPEVMDACRRAEIACIPGTLTPTEVRTAIAAGASAVKIFPAASVGGPSHIKALVQVFPDVPLCPTGGVSAESIPDYFAAGAAFVGLGGRLVDPKLIAAGDKPAVLDAARAALAAAGIS